MGRAFGAMLRLEALYEARSSGALSVIECINDYGLPALVFSDQPHDAIDPAEWISDLDKKQELMGDPNTLTSVDNTIFQTLADMHYSEGAAERIRVKHPAIVSEYCKSADQILRSRRNADIFARI
ncbi:hypothetical protein [Halioglobus sp. HI00S01]|uniref:hypothetical protein n=1 Tax=Halioglobus sp. HI00S01 TaxID=1822214 RepID=UPI0012E74891|nr:hypothetical protein [Halioglobus sp. HI00S01]